MLNCKDYIRSAYSTRLVARITVDGRNGDRKFISLEIVPNHAEFWKLSVMVIALVYLYSELVFPNWQYEVKPCSSV
ncbi:MAG: hypothetical protein ABSH06_19200 [Thermodesulfobacteriota bacterium]